MDDKELAKMKRYCVETAGEIHDIVEDRLWSDYHMLPELAEKIVQQVEAWKSKKQEQSA